MRTDEQRAEQAQRMRDWRAKNPERSLASDRRYRLANPEERRAAGAKWLAKNRERKVDKTRQWHEDNKAHRRAWRAEYVNRKPDMYLLESARRRAKKNGLVFNISRADVQIPTRCPVLGFELTRGVGAIRPESPTLDRIDSTRGYEPGNVWVISHRANRIKSDATLEELENIVAALRSLRVTRE